MVKTIRELRAAQGWTQLELANRLGVTPSTVYSWERGRYEPKASKLRAIAQAFGVSMDNIAILDETARPWTRQEGVHVNLGDPLGADHDDHDIVTTTTAPVRG